LIKILKSIIFGCILINFDDISQKSFVIAVKFGKVVRYIHEIILIKHAKPNQVGCFVCYSRVFVISVIVITEFDCRPQVSISTMLYEQLLPRSFPKA